MTGNIDAAIALLHGQDTDAIPEERYLNEIIDIGILAGSAAPVPGETLYMRGRTTSTRSKGQISNNNATTNTGYKNYSNLAVLRTGQWEISPAVGFTDFSVEGDSGSICVNEHNQAVLLIFSADLPNHRSYANNIKTVETALNISILDSTFHATVAGKEGVPLSSMTPSQAIFSLANAMEELEAELYAFQRRQTYVGIIQDSPL